MTNREAMQQALEALEADELAMIQDKDGHMVYLKDQAITALRAALAQPEQEPTQWREMVVVSLVREGVNKHKARELADHFAAQRPWQGLTDEDKQTAVWTDGTFGGGALWAQQLLKERNT
jgi:ABC-type histidine transport system ATPase subunit